MVAEIPLDWVEEIKEEVFAVEAAPLLPPAEPFPTSLLSAELEKRLGLKVAVAVGETKVMGGSEVALRLAPTTSRLFSVALSSYKNPVYISISHESLNKIASWLLEQDLEAAVSLQGTLQESFYLFLGAAAIDAVQATGHFKECALRLLSTAAELQTPGAMLAIPITVQSESLLLLISKELQKEIKNQAWQKEDSFLRETALSSKINLAARLLLELVPLHYSDVQKLNVGSFLFLEKAQIVPEISVQIVIGKRAFFAGRVVNNNLTIVALAEPLEEIKKMSNVPPEENPNYFLGEDEEFFVEDAELAKVLKEQQPVASPAAEESPAPVVATAPAKERRTEPAITSLSDIPLQVEVVVGYMRLSIKDLASMQVGGSYTLGSPVTAHVDLLVNGKRIAKGELIKSGDVLGVRIISL